MAIRIELTDNRVFLLDATLDQWEGVFQLARTRDAAIEVQLPDGNIIPVDPREIRAFREEPEGRGALADQFPEAATA
jgi:hypothetical protein